MRVARLGRLPSASINGSPTDAGSRTKAANRAVPGVEPKPVIGRLGLYAGFFISPRYRSPHTEGDAKMTDRAGSPRSALNVLPSSSGASLRSSYRHLMPLREDASTVRLTHREYPNAISCGPDLICTARINDDCRRKLRKRLDFSRKRRIFSSWFRLGHFARLYRLRSRIKKWDSGATVLQPYFGNLCPSARRFESVNSLRKDSARRGRGAIENGKANRPLGRRGAPSLTIIRRTRRTALPSSS